jgi:hypothetical protein
MMCPETHVEPDAIPVKLSGARSACADLARRIQFSLASPVALLRPHQPPAALSLYRYRHPEGGIDGLAASHILYDRVAVVSH